MYQSYYHFKEAPFNITADPEFFFSSSRHQEAVAHLEFGVQSRRGIIVLTGEIGTGKTTLCRTLLSRLDPSVKTALVLNPNFTNIQLLQFILKDLGISTETKNKFALMDALNTFLIEESNRGHNVVLVIDESQNLTVPQLEQIRLLSNLETEKHKLLQIILVGQPELLTKLRLNSLRQLNQRISVRYHILPLDKNELKGYVQHRLKIASGHATPYVEFNEEALSAVFEISKGTPRLINLICDRALLAGYTTEAQVIDKSLIYKSAQEVM